jgi:hypothetical protein
MAFTAEGQGKRRVLFPEIRGARQFALHPARGRVFFAITSDASIVASSLPGSIFDEGT